MKTLIVYYSRTNITKQIAEKLQSELNCDIEEISDDKKYGGKSADFKYSLYSTKLVFHFDSDGPLAYLDGMTLKVSVPFEKFFKE